MAKKYSRNSNIYVINNVIIILKINMRIVDIKLRFNYQLISCMN
jgi:hypothetical protein